MEIGPIKRPYGQPMEMSSPEYITVYEIKGAFKGDNSLPGLMGVWEEGGYSFVFFEGRDVDLEELRGPGIELRHRHSFRYEDWIGGRFEAMEVGSFLIHPPWIKVEPSGKTELVIDPGVVFGSGLHFTTRSCLEILGDLILSRGCIHALDLGTGTGILAIAMAKLGSKVMGIDNNPLCLQIARRNVVLNKVEDMVSLELADVLSLDPPPVDLIVANLTGDLILKLISNAVFNVDFLLLSGLTRSFVNPVRDTMAMGGYQVLEHLSDEIWNTILFKSRGG